MLHRSRVEIAHEFLIAKEIEYDKHNIFEFFSITQQLDYYIIELEAL